MKIRNKLILGFASSIFIIVLIAGISLYLIRKQSDLVVFHSAENLAQSIVLSITSVDRQTNTPPIFPHKQRLQDYVNDFRKVEKYDIVVVDRNQKILADIEIEDVNTLFSYDSNDEVGKTIQDGLTRIFVEKSKDYPEGAYSVVVPIKQEKEGEIAGAVILEYTSLLKEYRNVHAEYFILAFALFILAVLLGLFISYHVSKSISTPIARLQKAAVQISRGDLNGRIEIKQSEGELGDLANAFETMRTNTQEAFGKLENEISVRKKAEEDLKSLVSELQSAIEEIKTLRGIVPICTTCKKIRDDQGYWQQVDAYVASHTEAQFSHSICPECAKKLYPQFYKGNN